MDFKEKIKQVQDTEELGQRRELIQELLDDNVINNDIIDILCINLKFDDHGLRDICSLGLTQLSEDFQCYAAAQVVKYIETRDIVIRNLAGDLLIKYGNCGVSSLVPYLSDDDFDIRKYALDIIGLNDGTEHLDMIYQMLDDPDTNVRASAAEAIGNICFKLEDDDENTIIASETLIEYYENDEEDKIYIIDALAKIARPENESFIIDKMTTEEDVFIQFSCIEALSLNGQSKELCYKLLEELPNNTKMIQPVILKTINAIAFRIEENIELPMDLRYIAHNAILDDDQDIQAAGLLALGDIILPEDIQIILQQLNAFDYETKAFVVQLILFNTDNETMQLFIEQFMQSDDSSQINIALDILTISAEFFSEISEEKRQIIFITMLKYAIINFKGYSIDIIDFLLNNDRELTIAVLTQLLDEFSNTFDIIELLDSIQKLSIIEFKEILASKQFNDTDANNHLAEVIKNL